MGLNVGFEQDGKGQSYSRPILVIKKYNKEVFLGLPLTTQEKVGKYYINVRIGDLIQRKIIISQIRLFDSKRLRKKIATIDEAQFFSIKKAVIRLLG